MKCKMFIMLISWTVAVAPALAGKRGEMLVARLDSGSGVGEYSNENLN
jgi:hypothetical protein